MRSHTKRMFGLAMAALVLAGSAEAQGKSKAKSQGKSEAKQHEHVAKPQKTKRGDVITSEGVVIRRDDRVPGNGVKVPPGLAKKPGQMPPGQYKKRYGTNEGASVLSDILRRRGFAVDRIVPSGESQWVYYRMPDGSLRRVIVSPGTDRLRFTNLPTAILQEVLARLY
jgi:hypothetical protein